MKVGNLVKLDAGNRWLEPEEFKAIGVILQVLNGGSHRKNTSYEVMWSTEIWTVESGRIGWHTSRDLVGVK